jgi:pantoate--beta-alanine ligase
MPKIVRRIEPLRRCLDAARRAGKSIGFVPTMGALHEGHLELVRNARAACDLVVVSIFVNPTQFGPTEDFDRYPRDLRRDTTMLARAGCDLVFAPSTGEMYPKGFSTSVRVEGLSEVLCGQARPGHFAGVAVVVLKLLLAVMPDRAFFGEKDYQQLVVIRRLTEDLAFPAEIVGVPTVREKDGLALSSRNAYLTGAERVVATALYRSLELARLLVASGERRSQVVKGRLTSFLLDAGVSRVDYVAVVDPQTLDPVQQIHDRVRLLVAAWVGSTRLIDNAALGPELFAGQLPLGQSIVGVILAAGEGKRMKSRLPKVMHPVAGKSMLAHVIAACKRAGVKELVVVVGHGGAKVTPLVKRLGGRTVTQEVQRGTGHAVLQAFPLFAGFKGNVLVLSGDTPLVTAETIKRITDAHRGHNNAITFGTARVPDAKGYGRIVRDERGSFARIVEERDADPATRLIDEVNGGLYCFRSQALFDCLPLLTADNSQREYYLTEAIDLVKARGGRVEAVLVDDHAELAGVNTPRELALARKLFAARR